jgi:hypothetical protein
MRRSIMQQLDVPLHAFQLDGSLTGHTCLASNALSRVTGPAVLIRVAPRSESRASCWDALGGDTVTA